MAVQTNEDPDILTTIRRALHDAGSDDRQFVELLGQHAAGRKRTRSSRNAAPIDTASPQPVRSREMLNDPRYLSNARKLAERTLGGERFVGALRVAPNEMLSCVAVGNDRHWGCTGTLVSPNVVITAGHCGDFATRVYFGFDVARPGKVVKVRQRVRHPSYRRGKHHDVMVLLLDDEVHGIAPARVAPAQLIEACTDGRVVGFGTTDAAGTFRYGVKRCVDVPIVSASCSGQVDSQDDAMAYGCDLDLELVAGRPLLERDACRGDSGGPLYLLGPGGEWLVAGATSRATDSAMHGCGDGGVYVRVDRYLAWIDGIAGASGAMVA